jgi:hypothetical protein
MQKNMVTVKTTKKAENIGSKTRNVGQFTCKYLYLQEGTITGRMVQLLIIYGTGT